MQSSHVEIQSLNAEVVAVSSSSVADHAALARKIGARFPILADEAGAAIRAYGVLHEDALPFTDKPHARPAEIVVDEQGVIRERFLTDNWRVRARPEALIAALRGLQR